MEPDGFLKQQPLTDSRAISSYGSSECCRVQLNARVYSIKKSMTGAIGNGFCATDSHLSYHSTNSPFTYRNLKSASKRKRERERERERFCLLSSWQVICGMMHSPFKTITRPVRPVGINFFKTKSLTSSYVKICLHVWFQWFVFPEHSSPPSPSRSLFTKVCHRV